jgi:hypothetical protein
MTSDAEERVKHLVANNPAVDLIVKVKKDAIARGGPVPVD